jgi:hypothetical protein
MEPGARKNFRALPLQNVLSPTNGGIVYRTRNCAISTPEPCQDRKVAAIRDARDRRGLRVSGNRPPVISATSQTLQSSAVSPHPSLQGLPDQSNRKKIVGPDGAGFNDIKALGQGLWVGTAIAPCPPRKVLGPWNGSVGPDPSPWPSAVRVFRPRLLPRPPQFFAMMGLGSGSPGFGPGQGSTINVSGYSVVIWRQFANASPIQ